MNAKQRRFVEEYQVDLNGAQAAIRAGYAVRSAKVRAYKLLQRADIAAAVARGKAERVEALSLSADRVLQEYARIAFADIAEYLSFGPDGLVIKETAALAPGATAAIAEVTESKTSRGGTVRFKLYDKLAALNALARYLGLGSQEKLLASDVVEASAVETDVFEIARRIAFALRQAEPERTAAQQIAP